VVRDAKAPCLVLPGPLQAPLQRVLVPIDLSEPALHALDVALSWSSSLGPSGGAPQIVVLHVIPQVYDRDDVPFDTAQISTRIHDAIDAAEERTDTQAIAVREEVRWNDNAVQAILEFMKEEKTDLVVLGTHGHGLIRRALIGSVASGVARRSDCPVLLVPPALWQEAPES
jgi:nucleotide-binding universal stress UspA family protein